jgi:drug/metabolite transporter (DMT)-like permease
MNAQSPTSTAQRNVQSVGIVLLSVLLGAVGQLMLKSAAVSMGKLELSPQLLVTMATNPRLILAVAIYGVSAVFWLLALSRADLSFVYPFLSLTYIAVLLGSTFLFSEVINPTRILGFAVIIGGLLIIAQGERAAHRGSQK